ncbi:MAG: TlpA family protein disulfide reductase [Candidatus Caldatribacteriaceae bacterium]
MKKAHLVVLTLFVVLGLLAGCIAVAPTPSSTPTCPSDMEEKDFTLPLLQGGSLRLSDYLGKPVLLTFFTPTCPHCIQEAPILEAAYRKYKDTHDLVVIGVGYIGGSSIEALRQFVEDAGITHPVAIDTSETRVYSLYGVSGVPYSFFFNRCGTIVQESGELTESTLERYLQKIL